MTATISEVGVSSAGRFPEEMQQPPRLLPAVVLAVAVAHYNSRLGLAAEVAAAVLRWWAQLDPRDLDESWTEVVKPGLMSVLLTAQRRAVSMTEPYYTDLDSGWAQRVEVTPPVAVVNRDAFVGLTADQRDIDSLLDTSLIRTKTLIAAGMTVDDALEQGEHSVMRTMVSETKDAGREADGAALVARPTYMGYYRMLNLPSCDRCVVLAGKWYRWSDGFDRHPNCDCEHVPSIVGKPGQRRVDRDDYDPAAFDPMEAVRQGRVNGLTKAETKAILKDGADLNRIVNAKRTGLRTLVGGPKQRARRPTAAYIYHRAAGDRDKAVRDLIRNGYILPT